MADAAKVVPVVPVASLSSLTANRVVSTLKKILQNKCETLKAQLLLAFELSEAKQAHKLHTSFSHHMDWVIANHLS